MAIANARHTWVILASLSNPAYSVGGPLRELRVDPADVRVALAVPPLDLVRLLASENVCRGHSQHVRTTPLPHHRYRPSRASSAVSGASVGSGWIVPPAPPLATDGHTYLNPPVVTRIFQP
ncbi:MAG: hypothetical protein F4087_14285 [Gemmatimonadetes bacterium]|nr:hypothetical protein [Gemmatimonadota bacterium]MYD12228.1 hypothetical protein [Gemmatimonadota bacterium]MYE70803.1 hypothetical protein [Gemmatimonadota bacterium]MYI66034.1 hypothetical protein [Gemmatimonadota bacterium]MYJ69657.1 hypothetical protein [Gemmatimonadota bacterium]